MFLHICMLTVWENFISLCYQLEHLVSFFNIVLVLVGMPSQCQLTISKPYTIMYIHSMIECGNLTVIQAFTVKIVGEDSNSGSHVDTPYIKLIGQPHVINWLIRGTILNYVHQIMYKATFISYYLIYTTLSSDYLCYFELDQRCLKR